MNNNFLKAKLNPICHLLTLLRPRNIFYVSSIRVNTDVALLVLFAYAFFFVAVITALTLTLCTVFITHTNSIYGALHYALLLMITATAERVSLSFQAFAPIHCCPAAGSLQT